MHASFWLSFFQLTSAQITNIVSDMLQVSCCLSIYTLMMQVCGTGWHKACKSSTAVASWMALCVYIRVNATLPLVLLNVNVGHGQLEAGKAGNVRCVPLTSQRTLFCRHRFKCDVSKFILFLLKCFLMCNDPVQQHWLNHWCQLWGGTICLSNQRKVGGVWQTKCFLAFTYFDAKNKNTDWLKKKGILWWKKKDKM